MSQPVPPGAGRTFLVGGSIVAAGLSGFYLNMLRNKRKQEEAGTNPHHEQIIAHISRKPGVNEDLPALPQKYSDNPPAFRGTGHKGPHVTLANYKNSPQYAEEGEAIRFMVPSPQRGRADAPDRAYTKSPDYASNYGKTTRPEREDVVLEIQ